MNTVMESIDQEVPGSMRQVYINKKMENEEEYRCKCHGHPDCNIPSIRMATIKEINKNIEDSDCFVQSDIEQKISSASCHKRRQGYVRKMQQQIRSADYNRDTRGLERCAFAEETKAQNDTGATHNITNNKQALTHFRAIPAMPISGIAAEGTAIYATGKGYLPMQSDEGDVILVECLYSAQASGTLLSATAITKQYNDIYLGWSIHANTRNDTGYMQFIHADGINHATFNMYCENRMWYHYIMTNAKSSTPTIRKLSSMSEYELWHHRLGHCNDSTLSSMHKYVCGVPKLKIPDFYKCQTCSFSKIWKDSSTKTRASLKKEIIPEEKIHPGQHLHMDFGFVRGSAFSKKDELGRTITSIDGFCSYLIIVDRATRYKWIFLTTTKHPPLDEIESVLKKFTSITDRLHCTVRTDQGGELGRSNAFRELIKKFKYTYEPTGANSSKQNGIAERPNQDLKRMTRCLLHAAGLDSSYWSYAMNHAAYLLNRIYHSSIKNTPYHEFNGVQPELGHLRIFGSKCFFQHTKTNQKDLDIAGESGTFLGYTATTKNVYVQSDTTKKIHIALHKSFDEAHMTAPQGELPPMAIALQKAGYNNDIAKANDATVDVTEEILKIQLLSDDAVAPTRSTTNSAGLDLSSTVDAVIKPRQTAIIPIDIAIEPQPGLYAQICTRSSFAAKGVMTLGGVIDADYRGNVKVILQNNSDKDFQISKQQRVAQLLLKKISLPTVQLVDTLSDTTRGTDGFGSTEKKDVTAPTFPADIPHNLQSTAAAAATAEAHDNIIEFSSDPYDNTIEITIKNTGEHPTRGLDVTFDDKFEKVQLLACEKGTPAGKIDKWRSTLRNGFILSLNGIPVTNIAQLRRLIRDLEKDHFVVKFGTLEKQALHPQRGVPQLYFDQLNHVGKHLFQMKHDIDWQSDEYYEASIMTAMPKGGILPKGKRRGEKLTRRKLKLRDDWQDWAKSEFLQLDQYEKQQMFGEPCELPDGANTLPFLWAYNIKDDGRKKARCVCNGAPSKGTVTLGPTYAGSLDQTGARIFWAAAAHRNLRVYGADVSNAFAEAPPPMSPLYMELDDQYREWWHSKGRKAIPKHYVLPVKRALQGHPEAPRLWAKLIDGLIKDKLGLKATTHEPCLYSGKYNGTDILFLRQVDDFAIACPDEDLAKKIIENINEHMSVQIKYLGLLTRFNGVDVEQTRDYIKIYNNTYIKKIIHGHRNWLKKDYHCHNFPIPMKSENDFTRKLEQAVPPTTDKEKVRLQREMKMNYRQAIGELIYAMVTCRPDISFPLIKLSQYSINPAREHYDAVKEIFYYLQCTPTNGIHYWRSQPNTDLPPPLRSHDTENDNSEARIQDKPGILKSATDSDWGGDTTHRKSITGLVIKLAGGCIYYKTKFQPTIALSSTEAEFVAATDTAKSILYIRSILQEIGLEQQHASIIYIDNNGALNMANQQQPTKGTRHMELKQFAIQQWVEKDLIYLRRITTEDNYADAMTKALGRTKHYTHFDYIMGCLRPTFADHSGYDTAKTSYVSRMGGVSVATSQKDRQTVQAHSR